ncbi:MAG: SMC-Scp complex subunit ScpB [Chitinophagaceae bacterium]|nr:SMC-Scp complex subunit ScpB [Chitinophagaceae bacterium]
MTIPGLIPHIEALIFASDRPLPALEITEFVNNIPEFSEETITLDQVEAALEGIHEKYSEAFYPFEVVQSGGGWQFLTRKEFYSTVAQINGEKFLKRLSATSLETLAIIAYKQPVTKGEIEAIRGVNADYAVHKLLEKELIIISGRNEHAPGQPLLYSTSKSFMDYFGINSSDELPKISEVIADQLVEPTALEKLKSKQNGEEEQTEDDEDVPMAVSDDGELISSDNKNNEEK